MARSIDKGYETSPGRVGAPLPTELTALPVSPSLAEIHAEMDRCEVELMYAIARHRKAWSAMRRRAEYRDEQLGKPGGLAAIDSDAHWKKATGDVTWWRGEMEARSAVYLALQAMVNQPFRRPVPSEMGFTCNWCEDPANPSPANHPDGTPRHVGMPL